MNERYALNNVLNNYFAVLKNGTTGTNLNEFFQFQLMISNKVTEDRFFSLRDAGIFGSRPSLKCDPLWLSIAPLSLQKFLYSFLSMFVLSLERDDRTL